MNAPVFDTLAYVKHLTAAGVPEAQAEAMVTGHVTYIAERLATKQDIDDIRRDTADIRRDMKAMETSLKRDIKEVETRLTTRIGGMILAAVAIVTVFDKFI